MMRRLLRSSGDLLAARSSGRIRSRLRRLLAVPIAAMLAAAGMSITLATSAQAACANPVVCENQLTGTPESTWQVPTGAGGTIQGFADPFSASVGQAINFKVQSQAASYRIDIYRVGYYGGSGARLVTTLSAPNIPVSKSQPACNTNTATGL